MSASSSRRGTAPVIDLTLRWLAAPQPILRLEIVRILLPLAMLGFMSGRMAHADELLGEEGFHVPDLGVDDFRQPLYLAPLSNGTAWLVATVFVTSALAVSLGFRTRLAALALSASLVVVALSDRLAAFTVSKLSPMLALAIFLSPAGARYGVDAWLRLRRSPKPSPLPTEVSCGAVRFFQVFLVVMYFSSGYCKLRGEWLENGHLLWTHVHDSYQTAFAWVFANAMPKPMWTVLQALVATLEVGAPIWFIWNRSRPVALVLALGMHAMIGLMFGPVKWFALLMMSLLLGSYLSEDWLERLARRLGSRFG